MRKRSPFSRGLLAVGIAVIAAVIVIAWPGADSVRAPTASSVELHIENYAFPKLTVAAGVEVLVTTSDDEPHTVTADDGGFDITPVTAGESVAFSAPTQPGSYPYTCQIHPTMRGTLEVTS